MQQRAPDINVSSWVIHPVACALVGIGAKCWMIARYGSPTPFWDQWDAEAAGLYPNFLSGTLHFSDLIAPHNEHLCLCIATPQSERSGPPEQQRYLWPAYPNLSPWANSWIAWITQNPLGSGI